MKILIILTLMIGQSFAGTMLATDWVSESATHDATKEISDTFTDILDAQANALDMMENKNKSLKIFPFGFKMQEMVTDISVSKSGLMGISALKANTGVEIKWKKLAPSNLIAESDAVDIQLEGDVSGKELDSVTDSIVSVAMASGKIKNAVSLRSNVIEALQTVNEQVKLVGVTSYNRWQARALRLDLNFSTSGKVWFVARAGVALRLRMEWKLIDVPLTNDKMLTDLNDQTKFVVKTLGELNQALDKVSVLGFEPKKVMIGVGASQKKNFFGMWKYSVGFVGWLGFVPVTVNNKSFHLVRIPAEIMNEDFTIGGEDESSSANKGWWPWRKRSITRTSFSSGLEKSIQSVAFFAERAQANRSSLWQVAEVKTINDVSYTGFFGLADVSTRGIVEIDFKRKQ